MSPSSPPCFPRLFHLRFPLRCNFAPGGAAAAGPSPPPRPLTPGSHPATAPPLAANPGPLFSWQQVTLPGTGQSGRLLAVQAAGGGRDAPAKRARHRARSAQSARPAAGRWRGRGGSVWPPAVSPGSSSATRPAGTSQVSRVPTLRGRRCCASAQWSKGNGGPFSAPEGARRGKGVQ